MTRTLATTALALTLLLAPVTASAQDDTTATTATSAPETTTINQSDGFPWGLLGLLGLFGLAGLRRRDARVETIGPATDGRR